MTNADTIQALIEKIDHQRRQRGFLPVAELLERYSSNLILDPLSTLISTGVEIGSDNVFYPGVIIECRNTGTIAIGSGNLFYPGAFLLADRGKITVGSRNEFGDGGVRIKATLPDSLIVVGDEGRYMNGPEITGKCTLGSGTQLLGAISVQDCTLGAGESHRNNDPNRRGGLLKGGGMARNLVVNQGEVINGRTSLEQANIERQAVYHPPKP